MTDKLHETVKFIFFHLLKLPWHGWLKERWAKFQMNAKVQLCIGSRSDRQGQITLDWWSSISRSGELAENLKVFEKKSFGFGKKVLTLIPILKWVPTEIGPWFWFPIPNPGFGRTHRGGREHCYRKKAETVITLSSRSMCLCSLCQNLTLAVQ